MPALCPGRAQLVKFSHSGSVIRCAACDRAQENEERVWTGWDSIEREGGNALPMGLLGEESGGDALREHALRYAGFSTGSF